jgi:hypothetical protein
MPEGDPCPEDAGVPFTKTSKESSMNGNLFGALCEQLGYTPDGVLSVRVDADQVVVVTRASGQLRVTTFRQSPGGLELVSRGRPVGPRRQLSA